MNIFEEETPLFFKKKINDRSNEIMPEINNSHCAFIPVDMIENGCSKLIIEQKKRFYFSLILTVCVRVSCIQINVSICLNKILNLKIGTT